MKSSFFEFNVALSGLHTAKNGLGTVGHNMANATTPGYSRQYVIQSASHPLSTYNNKGMVGTGSEVTGIGQIRSFYLDKQYWNQASVLGQYTTTSQQLTLTEITFNEFSDTGLSGVLNQYFKSLQDLIGNAGENSYRRDVISTTESFLTSTNTIGMTLRKQQLDINNDVSVMVSRINTLGDQIRNLNERIFTLEANGDRANDLRDQRALLVDELSKYVNVDVTETDGKYSVNIDGQQFVSHYDCTKLNLVPRSAADRRNVMDAEGLYDIVFDTGTYLNIYSPSLKGELKGLIDVRDGNNGDELNSPAGVGGLQFRGIPYYLEQMNVMLRAFAMAMNEGVDSKGNAIADTYGGHKGGYDYYGNPGEDLFMYLDANGNETGFTALTDYDNINIFNITLNSSIVADPKKLACSTEPGEESNNKIVMGMASIANYQGLLNQGTLNDFVSALASELGVDLKQAKNYETNYSEVKVLADNQRLQVMGVDFNEETVTMLQYQMQYQAAAKLISVINDLYDRMINQMGV